jgi:hypothetical protein
MSHEPWNAKRRAMNSLAFRCLLAGSLLLGACGGPPSPYLRHADAARQAYSAGRYAEAAEHWQQAEAVSDNQHDKDEAAYRAASSLARAGKFAEARALLQKVAREAQGTRRARAAFDLAADEIKRGDPRRGYVQLRKAILRFPNDGVARDALRRYIAYQVESAGADAAIRELLDLDSQLAGTELEDSALFARAKLLEQQREDEPALKLYRDIAARFPYPAGAYWDDAMMRAAAIARRLGRTGQSEALLLEMLEQREDALLTGSYERQYDAAYFELGNLALQRGAWREARERWLDLCEDFPDSRLRDDALWAAATVSVRQQDPLEACRLAERLSREQPDSRYVACAQLVCPGSTTTRRCAAYIERAFMTGHVEPAQDEPRNPSGRPH